jgi:hypothetical protein
VVLVLVVLVVVVVVVVVVMVVVVVVMVVVVVLPRNHSASAPRIPCHPQQHGCDPLRVGGRRSCNCYCSSEVCPCAPGGSPLQRTRGGREASPTWLW